jgi:ADP-ribosyl-[dinitrogen reductase] hydrolase
MKERYRATLIGCALGDSLGMAVEGWKKEQIQKYVGRIEDLIDPVVIKNSDDTLKTQDEFGKLKSWTKNLKKGEYTDDTLLTLAIAGSIAQKGTLDFDDITQKQIETYNSCIQPDGSVKGAYGKTTMDAFERIKLGISPNESGLLPGLGTGPCMKVSPISLYWHANGNFDESLDIARKIGYSTHLDERSVTAGIMQVSAIYVLLNNWSKKDFLNNLTLTGLGMEKELRPGSVLKDKGNLTSKLIWICKNQDMPDHLAHDYLGSSSLAIEAYPFTLFMFQKYWDKPLEGLIETVNYGGDCDTTGAMYGALAGAKNGMIFPEKWLNQLQNKEKIIDLADQIYSLKK